MVKKNDGRISNKQKKEERYGKGKTIVCKNCKTEYDSLEIKDDIFGFGNKKFIQCDNCNEQIKLK